MRPALLLLALAACGDDQPSRPDAEVAIDPDAEPPIEEEPFVTITSHADGASVVGARAITVSGTIGRDLAESPIVEVEVLVDGVPVTATFDDDSFSADVTLGDGANEIGVTATDSRDLTGDDDVTVIYPVVAVASFAPASLVLGQTDFTTNTGPAAGPVGTPYPYGHACWVGDTLYVPSSDFNRVLGYRGFPARNGEPGDLAIGQPDLGTVTFGAGASGMEFPQTVDEADETLFVLDYSNNRILGYDTPPTTSGVAASFAVGQPDLTSSATGCTRATANFFDDFFVGHGKLIASDTGNHRVLIWNTIPTASGAQPDVVLGQADFTHCTVNDDNQDDVADAGPTARTLSDPIGIWSDGTRLFVVDSDNHRVLVWNTIPTASFTPADWALGSPDLTTGTGALAADRFNDPIGIAGSDNQLAVTDASNSRVLVWNEIPTSNVPATLVLGQSDLVHGERNDDDQNDVVDATPSARTLNKPAGVEFVRDALIVSDLDNQRMLVFGPLPCPAGEYEPPGLEGTCLDDPCQPDPCTGGQLCRNDTGAGVCR